VPAETLTITIPPFTASEHPFFHEDDVTDSQGGMRLQHVLVQMFPLLLRPRSSLKLQPVGSKVLQMPPIWLPPLKMPNLSMKLECLGLLLMSPQPPLSTVNL